MKFHIVLFAALAGLVLAACSAPAPPTAIAPTPDIQATAESLTHAYVQQTAQARPAATVVPPTNSPATNAPISAPITTTGLTTGAAGRVWGNPNAPVTIEEWSDFQ